MPRQNKLENKNTITDRGNNSESPLKQAIPEITAIAKNMATHSRGALNNRVVHI